MQTMPSALAEDPYLLRIVDITRAALAGAPCRAYLFGSRATGRARAGSDYDIALESDQDLDDALQRARAALEDSTIPFMVDLVDLGLSDDAFRNGVHQEGIQLWAE